MTLTLKQLLVYVLIILAGFMVGYCSRPEAEIIEKTECRIDTMKIVQPAEVRVDTFFREVRVHTTRLDTLCKTDTLHITDSILVYLPFERKEYSDTSYRAVISGYKPVLEEIDVYERVITKTVEKKPPLLSPYITGGISLDGDVSIGGGVFLRNKDAIGVEYCNKEITFRYIHKF